MGNSIGKKDLANLVGVTPGAISQAITSGRLVTDITGKRLDLDDPVNAAFMEKKKRAKLPKSQKAEGLTTRTGARPKTKVIELVHVDGEPVADRDPLHGAKQETQLTATDLLNMTLLHIYRRFGTFRTLIDYIDSVKKLEEIQLRQVKTARERGELVPKELVVNIFSFVEEAHARVLTDVPATLSRLLTSIMESEPEQEELEAMIAEELSKELINAKININKSLRKLKKDDYASTT